MHFFRAFLFSSPLVFLGSSFICAFICFSFVPLLSFPSLSDYCGFNGLMLSDEWGGHTLLTVLAQGLLGGATSEGCQTDSHTSVH